MSTDSRLPDYYAILQVHRQAETAIIESAYRRLAHIYHPDINPSEKANRRMADINEAYRILSDPSLRANYDSLSSYRQEPAYSAPREPRPVSVPVKRTSGSWWRWLLVLPAFPFGLLVPAFVFGLLAGWFSEDWLASWWYKLVASGMTGYFAVYCPGKVAPTWNRGLSIASGFVVALISGIALVGTVIDWQGSSSLMVILSLAVTLAASGIAVYQVWNDISHT